MAKNFNPDGVLALLHINYANKTDIFWTYDHSQETTITMDL